MKNFRSTSHTIEFQTNVKEKFHCFSCTWYKIIEQIRKMR